MPKPTDLELKLIDETEALSRDVSNGSSHDIQLQGKVIGRLGMLLCGVLRNGLVSVEECIARHGVCPEHVDHEGKDAPKIKYGNFELSGFKFRDLERWAIIAGIIYLVLLVHGIIPSPVQRADKVAKKAASALIAEGVK